ncbi:MAG TPA: hypothetical protein VF463_19650 [Sphingobium sp.]
MLPIIGNRLGESQFQHVALVAQTLGKPYLIGVFEKLHSGSMSRVEIGQRTPALRDFFRQFCLLDLKATHPVLISRHDARHIGRDDAIHQLLYLAFHTCNLCMQMLFARGFRRHAGIPQIAKHLLGERKQFRRWTQATEQRLELLFQNLTPHRTTIRRAALGLAEIIRVSLRTAR